MNSMTSLSSVSAHGLVYKKSKMDAAHDSDSMEAETIEVVPELPFQNDSDDCYSEFSDGNEFKRGNSLDDNNPDADEPFDEYAYQVSSNHTHGEPHAIWFDNSQLRSMSLNSSTTENDVILIDDDDEDDENGNQCGDKHNRGLLIHEQYDQKFHICQICHSKLSSSYNLKRHMMIHTGEKPFECPVCKRRFREQSDLRKHKKIHESELILKCSVCHRNPVSNRNTMKCIDCGQREAMKKLQRIEMDAIEQRSDAKNGKSFVCKFCDRVFGSSSNLKRHVMIHTGEKPFTCIECKRPFREMSTLKKHLITHRRQNSFQMNSFLREAIQPPKLTRHHNGFDKPKFVDAPNMHKCPLCKIICEGTDGLMNHILCSHRQNRDNIDKIAKPKISVRKFSKSPPPLIPINRATFNYANMKRS